jgi:hypothetical protein
MESSTPHIHAARVVALGPIEKLDVCPVKLSAGCDSLVTITFDLARPQARQPNLQWNQKKDNYIKFWDHRVSPSTE